MQNGGAGSAQDSEGNCGPPTRRKGEYGRSADPRIPFPCYCDPDDDVVPKRSRNSAPGRRDTRAADSEIYRNKRSENKQERRIFLVFGKSVVRITVQPALAGLCRCDDRMSRGLRVFAGVPVWRTVAAKCNATSLTGSQMNPGRADFHTFGTLADLRLLDRSNFVEMRTAAVSHE